MITTQKLIMFAIFFNLFVGIAYSAYYTPEVISFLGVNTIIENAEKTESSVESEEGLYGTIKTTINRAYESTVGNVITWGIRLLTFFFGALNPISITPLQFENVIEQVVATGVLLIRALLSTLLIIEAYTYIKNKKNT